jgi:hypothetical protein
VSTQLTLDCGCEVTVDHDRGDRGLTCGCGYSWTVRAASVARVTYVVERAPHRDLRGSET